DGMNDGWEVRHMITGWGEYFHPALDKAEDFWCDPPVSYSVWDFEYDRSGWCTWSGDGLRNLIESEHNTSPWSDDSDGDGVKDLAEITYGGYGSPPSYPATTTPHLAGHWKMDNDGQAPQLTDSSDNQNHGTIYGATFNSSGKFDEALRFDGSNDYVSLGNPSELQLGSGTDFTISVWIKTSMTSAGRLVDNKEASDGKGIRLHFTSNGARIQAQIKDADGDYINIYGLSTVHDNQWHHIVLSADRDENCRLYVDNKQEAAVSMQFIGNITSSTGWKLGGTTAWYNGYMDNLVIFTKAASRSEVTALYDGGYDYNEQPGGGSAPQDSDGRPIFPGGTGTNPKGVDDDDDGVKDGLDTDGDGLVDGKDNKVPISAYPDGVDADGDGYVDGEMNSSGTYVTNPRWFDTDGDLLPDGWEVENDLNPTSDSGDDGQNGDPDGDGATNFDEMVYGTNPNDDTDNPDASLETPAAAIPIAMSCGWARSNIRLPGSAWSSKGTIPLRSARPMNSR
ncbi:MAG: LamG domain-containing protein, partial [Planctomycetota bacterium]